MGKANKKIKEEAIKEGLIKKMDAPIKKDGLKKFNIENKDGRKARVPTGIPGFDELVEGGFPKNSSILVCGGPGTGKSIFSMEYLVKGVTEFNEKCLYVSFEQREEAIIAQGAQFGWNLEELKKSGKLKIMSVSIDKLTKDTIKEIQSLVRKEGITRMVIDSLSTLVINAPIYTTPTELAVEDVVGQNIVFSPPVIGDYVVKKFVYGFIEQLRNLECTTLLISEASQDGEYISRDTLSEFVCDGVVLISFESMGGAYSRSLIVRKMRQTKNDEDVHPVEISNSGIIVHKIE
jgi:KaiC/GvpD/RAD55 family RecA-like ATPase